MARPKGRPQTSVLLHDNFVREYVTDLGMAIKIIEAASYFETEERLSYLFGYFPEMRELTHWQLARLIGRTRESVTRRMSRALEIATI